MKTARWLALGALFALGSCIRRLPPEPPPAPVPTPVATQVPRLTHAQWLGTVRDLLGVEGEPGRGDALADVLEALARDLRRDPTQGGFMFDNHGASLSVDGTLWSAYQRAATRVAAAVVGDPARLARLAPPDADAEARAERFIRELGARAHRRPLEPSEVDGYRALFEAAEGAYEGLGAFESGARLVLEAMLQSPHFLYRIEGRGAREGGVVRLDAYELASRLSYALWDSMPDAALLARAADGSLLEPEVLKAEARRLLDDRRAEAVVQRFHAALFESERKNQIAPAPGVFLHVSERFPDYTVKERELFVTHQVLAKGAGYAELLTSPETFVNAELAGVYGLSGDFDERFVPVTLDPTERRGLLTQTLFLASHATSRDPDPIHRGVFVARRVLCEDLTAPSDLPPLPAASGRTNRQTVEAHTERPDTSCAFCHAETINPLGFPFERYDAVGRRRELDNGLPIDSSSQAPIDGQSVAVTDGIELALALAGSRQAHACYARRWLERAYGRPATARDEALIEQLGAASQGGMSVKELLVELVSAPAFFVTHEGDLR